MKEERDLEIWNLEEIWKFGDLEIWRRYKHLFTRKFCRLALFKSEAKHTYQEKTLSPIFVVNFAKPQMSQSILLSFDVEPI